MTVEAATTPRPVAVIAATGISLEPEPEEDEPLSDGEADAATELVLDEDEEESADVLDVVGRDETAAAAVEDVVADVLEAF